MKTIAVAPGLTLPLDVVTQTVAILAKRRAGKSYTMRRLVEQLFKAGQQVVLVDPKGDQWGVRSAADGRGPGLPIVILGGERGDVPLESSGGEVVAKLVVEDHVSALLDLSLFRKSEVATFMTAFLEHLYRLKARDVYRTPVMLVIDEADAIAPQKPQHGEERMLGAAEDIVRRGGQRGIGCVLVTQRSAVLNKNVLTQAQMLVALRTIAPQDLAAMDAWIQVHGEPAQRKTLMESLPSLPIGDAWFWSPGWPTTDGIFSRVHVSPIETFDSGATPAPGAKPVEPKQLADVDLEALTRQMSATIARAKADDPRELRKRIAERDRELGLLKAELARGTQAATIERVEVPVPAIADNVLERLRHFASVDFVLLRQQMQAAADEILTGVKQVVRHGRALRTQMSTDFRWEHPRADLPVQRHTPRRAEPLAAERPGRVVRSAVARGEASVALGIGERKILGALTLYPHGADRETLTVLCGYKRSSRDTYLQRLQSRGLVDASNGAVCLTPAGIEALGDDYVPPPTGAELRRYWLDRLSGGEAALLKLVIEAHPKSLDRETLSDATGYKRSSRDTYLQRLSARKLITVEARGLVRASEDLFA